MEFNAVPPNRGMSCRSKVGGIMIVSSDELAQCLTKTAPTKIVVAYVGKGWRDFVDADRLETAVRFAT
jgi:hypothetical protein